MSAVCRSPRHWNTGTKPALSEPGGKVVGGLTRLQLLTLRARMIIEDGMIVRHQHENAALGCAQQLSAWSGM